MMFMFRDDGIIETQESHAAPPDWVEWIDVENGEYEFCDDTGQRYCGALLQSIGFFRREKVGLVPDGEAHRDHILSLVDRAKGVDSKRSKFPDLDSIRRYLQIM